MLDSTYVAFCSGGRMGRSERFAPGPPRCSLRAGGERRSRLNVFQTAGTRPGIELSPQQPRAGTPVAAVIPPVTPVVSPVLPPVAAIIAAIFAPVMTPHGSE